MLGTEVQRHILQTLTLMRELPKLAVGIRFCFWQTPRPRRVPPMAHLPNWALSSFGLVTVTPKFGPVRPSQLDATPIGRKAVSTRTVLTWGQPLL
jgi:hypothetical protein